MVTWILGRSGVGKTTALQQKLNELTGYERVYYLVPEQSSLELERKLSGAYPNVKVVSFRRLTNEIFRAFGGVAGTYMTPTRQTAMIYRVLAEKKKELCYYGSTRSTMSFVTRLAEVFSEFAMAGLTRQQVLPVIDQSGRQDWQQKYRDLFLLYEAYCAHLDGENRWAAEDLAVATDLARERGFFANTPVLLDGFFGFTGRQRQLLQVIFSQSPRVYAALLCDPQEKGLLFASAKGELAALRRLCDRDEVVVLKGPSRRLVGEDLHQLEQYLFASHLPAQKLPAQGVRLMVGSHLREELAMVAADIAKKVREQGCRYRDFALLAGSLDQYGPVAEGVFAKYGVPLFVDRGRPSLGKPVFAFVQSALRLVSPERYFRQEDLMILLKTGLCGEDPDLISRLENYCILWQINGEKLLREADWTQNPAGSGEMKAEQLALLEQLNALKTRLRGPLMGFKEAVSAGTGAALAQGVYQLLCDFRVEEHLVALARRYEQTGQKSQNAWEKHQGQRLRDEYLKLYGVLTNILDDIYSVFGDQTISLYDFEELIGLCGEEATLNLAPPTLDAVTLGEVTHSRLAKPKELYVVGCNQGVLPKPVSDNGLIGDGERRLFARQEIPCNATLQQNTLQAQYRLYAALFSTCGGITFTYSGFVLGGDALCPSVYVEKLKSLLEITPLYREDLNDYDFALTRESARDLIGDCPQYSKEILAQLGEQPLPPRNPDDSIAQEVVSRLFGQRLKLSYSQISQYQQCPFHYFMEKTMRIKAIEPVTFDAANIGTFIHYGMERLVKELKQEGFDYSKYNKEKIQQFGEKFATEYLADQLKDFNRSNRFGALYGRMTDLFCRVAENVLGELREGQYRPYEVEMKLDGVTLPLSHGRTVELIGSVDRVDTYEKDGVTYLKVTDYKTGKKTFEMKGITNRDGVQLPIYLYGLMKGGHWPNPVPAAACYMEARRPTFDTPVDPQNLEQQVMNFYRRDGAYTQDPTALSALDSAGGSRYFKVSYNKDGSLSKKQKVYEPALMQELVDHMERVIRDTAQEIFDGCTRVMPLKGGEHDPCKFCEFSATCGYREDHDPHREYNKEPFDWRKEVQ